MADMDMNELLDGPASEPTRQSRFAPKGSKFKPKPKLESSKSLPPSASNAHKLSSKESDASPLPKKEEIGTQPKMKIEHASTAVEMDIEEKPGFKTGSGVKDEEENDLMDLDVMETDVEFQDEVVREIDVYFTPNIDPNTRLYVLQYPLRPLWRPYELDERCEVVRVKPASSEFEIDLSVDVDSKNYDTDADPRVQMKKQVLTTSWKPPPSSGYAVGVLTGNKLHLNPVHAVVQLRPSMRHLDVKESKRRVGVPSNSEDAVKAEEPVEGKLIGLAKKQNKPPTQNKDAGEVWIPLKYHGLRSDMAARYLQKMTAREGSQINFSMSPSDYLNSLCPVTSSGSCKSKGPPIKFLLTLPLKERFKTWLLEGPPLHRFDTLKYLAPDESNDEILSTLVELAGLVQGLWVPKSSLVYGTDKGIEVFARDYVLSLFSRNVLVSNSQIPPRPQLAKPMKDVLNVLARERPVCNDWKLKELPDIGFIKLNPSLVKKQEEKWGDWEKNNRGLVGGKNSLATKPLSKSTTISGPSTLKSSVEVTTRTTNGATSGSAMSEADREAVTKALHKLFKSCKLCSFQQIRQRLKDMAVSESGRSEGFAGEAVAAANNIEKFPEELPDIVGQIAVNIHGICVPKSSPDHPQYDAFRKVVIDLFVAQGPNAKLKRGHIIEAAKMELKRDIPTAEYSKVLQELCVSQGSAWSLRSGD